MVSIRNGTHLGSCPFGIVSVRDGAYSGWCPFGMVFIRNHVHLGWCPFGMVPHSGLCPIWNGAPFGIVPIRDCAHSASFPFGIVSIWDCVHLGLCPFGVLSILDSVLSKRCLSKLCLSESYPFGQLSGYLVLIPFKMLKCLLQKHTFVFEIVLIFRFRIFSITLLKIFFCFVFTFFLR